MDILVLRASGNRRGSSAMLADEFARGAREAGHVVTDYDILAKEIKPCRGCNACGMAGPCVLKDDYEKELKGLIRAADMLVFAMPVYYYGWPSQAKVIVDRFYSFTSELSSARKKTALLAVAWDSTDVFEETVAYYRRLCRYMHFEDCGTITGGGCGTPSMTRATEYPKRAYELGRSL